MSVSLTPTNYNEVFSNMDTQERNYEKPSLSEYGKVKDLTAASSEGGKLDDDYPDDTPAEGIFS